MVCESCAWKKDGADEDDCVVVHVCLLNLAQNCEGGGLRRTLIQGYYG